jgi:hypothetical protein
MGFMFKNTEVSEDLREKGIRGTATIVKAEMSVMGGGMEYSGFMREKTVEQVLTGEKSMSKYKVELRIELPGREPYTASVKLPVPGPKVRYMTAGSTCEVLVDPKKDDHVAIDWDGAFQNGTLAQMVGNPDSKSSRYAAAAMKGAGVDIEAISKMQADAMAAGQTPGNVIIGGQLYGGTPAPAAVAPDPLDQLQKLAALRDSGVLTDEEFAAQKAKILAQ